MESITLSQGQVALVDDGDFEYINQWKWDAFRMRDRWYASRNLRVGLLRKTTFMHREITGAPKGMVVDHINGDGLDNRRENLRICTTADNNKNNKRRKDNTTGFKGVTWAKSENKFVAQIRYQGKRIRIGAFPTADEAARAYDRKAIELHGDFALLNFP